VSESRPRSHRTAPSSSGLIDHDSIDALLGLLATELEAGEAVELVVLGGSALASEGLLNRPTYDLDVLGRLQGGVLVGPAPLPDELVAAQERVMRTLGLSDGFLDLGVPRHMLVCGLPTGLVARLETRRYGNSLTVHFVNRFDQIHFKYLAMIENSDDRDKHASDLQALSPTDEELERALSWSRGVVLERLRRAQTLLLEDLLRSGSRDEGLLGLATTSLTDPSRRQQLGVRMLRLPRRCGKLYAGSVRAAGDSRRFARRDGRTQQPSPPV
jgi:hypothetical protein